MLRYMVKVGLLLQALPHGLVGLWQGWFTEHAQK